MSSIKELYEQLSQERDAILVKSASLRTERETLRVQVAPLMDRVRELDKLIHAAEQPALNKLNRELSKLVKADPSLLRTVPV